MPLQDWQAQGLQEVIFGSRRRVPPTGGGIEECRIHHITTAGAFFTRPDFDHGKTVFGPAPYIWPQAGVTGAAGTGPHTHTIPVPGHNPTTGDRCLVVWAGPSQSNPWVLGWWPV